MLELILATAIGAIVLIVINTTFFAALRLHNTTHQKIDDDLVIQRTLGIVRKDLAGIMVPGNPQATTYTVAGQLTTETNSTNELDGTSERVTPDLYTNSGKVDGWTSFADVQMVSYYLSPTPGGASTKDLVRVVTRNLFAANDTTVETQILLTGVNVASLSYFDGENWLETWDSATSSSLPAALKFSLVLTPHPSDAASSDASPIELVVPVIVKTTTTLQQEAAATAGQQ